MAEVEEVYFDQDRLLRIEHESFSIINNKCME